MSSSQTITLFTQRQDSGQRSSSFVVSILMHVVLLGVVGFGLVFRPKVNDRVLAERYTMRRLDLQSADLEQQSSRGSQIEAPSRDFMAHLNDFPGKSAAQPEVLHEVAQATPGPQTLLQPTLPVHLPLPQMIPIPTILMWSAEKTPVKTIVAPQPVKPVAAEVKPSANPPNQETNLADRSVTSAKLAVPAQAVQPSTTSPLVLHGPNQTQLAPLTTTKPSAQPTPTAVLSISNLHMKEGAVTLPPVNESAAAKAAPTPMQIGKVENKASGTGAGQGTGNSNPSAAAVNRNIAKSETAQQGESGTGSVNIPGTQRISLPKNGQFGSVVLGASLKDTYPETAELWSGRMAYTVYLHVGLARSWILQYSLPRSADAAEGGNVSHLEAPWPYAIVRPNIDAGAIDAEALMVHGFVNLDGRFENLSVAFPPEFAQKQFVLNSLAQWQFRPAMQNGKPIRLEVLLIIPEVSE